MSAIRSSGSSSPIWSLDERPRIVARGSAAVTRGVDGDREAFETAPAVADPEQVERVDEGGARGIVATRQNEREQSARPREITDEMVVTRAGGEGGMEDARDLGAGIEPACDPERARLMVRQPHRERA